ncbi:MAG: glutamate--tRNA ligase [Candidatus Krumholzibacteria bacterium]|nr:glutamate--tRNA ligase [Candidatus Krumholzibacteria bacterium]
MSDLKMPRVRFAPSPTGFLHVGGARTALFNWLYARSQGGTFVLRIEDTDQERSTEESYAAILRGMEWLGLDWDEGPNAGGDLGPYLQSERLDIYREQLDKLIASGDAYKCFCSAEDLENREKAVRDGGGNWEGYDGHCRDLTADQIAAYEAEGKPCAYRLRTPTEGSTFWYDVIVDKREFQNEVLVDRVIFKADGFPTYQFAVVVDDHLMGISHVLRGDDHVSNTPFQILIYNALGWKLPKFGHMPMILGPDRKRLSKRHGATSVEEFQNLGILPAAMLNYLALLGWSPGGSADEVMSAEAIIKKFSLKKVNSSPAAFDYDKLNHINGEHIKRLSAKERLVLAKAIAAKQGWALGADWLINGADNTDAYLARVIGTLGNRFSSLITLPEQIGFFFSDDHFVDQESWDEHVATDEARPLMIALADAIEAELDLGQAQAADAFEEVIRTTAEKLGVKAGQLIHPSRVALSGQSRSAGIFEVMELMGARRTVQRLRAAASG